MISTSLRRISAFLIPSIAAIQVDVFAAGELAVMEPRAHLEQ